MPRPAKRPRYGSDIPGARQELAGIADAIDELIEDIKAAPMFRREFEIGLQTQAARLRVVVAEKMRRRGYERTTPETANKVTASIVTETKRLAKDTDWSVQKIGARLGISGGRVSEILNGLRDDEGNII